MKSCIGLIKEILEVIATEYEDNELLYKAIKIEIFVRKKWIENIKIKLAKQ
jgi:hypothetical protein